MNITAKRPKAIALLSGGADSILALHLMHRLDVELLALNFLTCFSPFRVNVYNQTLKETCRRLRIPFRTIFLGGEYLGMVSKPRFGYGKGMNPCIDCRIMTLRKAREIMLQENASFILTGEVVGQRPMSQMRKTIALIEKESDLRGRILRPLSAKLLPPTIAELKGIVDRSILLAINGRSRKPQRALAAELGIGKVPNAAGGCILTNKRFAQRARDLFQHSRDGGPSTNDAKLLRIGRHFRFRPEFKIAIGKNEKENSDILALAKEGDLLFILPLDIKGPVLLARGDVPDSDWPLITALLLRYSDIRYRKSASVNVTSPSGKQLGCVESNPMSAEESQKYLI